MLYPQSHETFSKEIFQNPPSAYRGAPFWAWNCKLEADLLERQVEQMKEMGLGGFHIHSRSGMATPYLSDDFMGLVKRIHEKGKQEGMLTWLYDEDRWPSGFAGGLLTKDKSYRARYLLMTPTPYGKGVLKGFEDSRNAAGRLENGTLLACYDVVLDEKGCLASYARVDEHADVQGTKWYAYLEVNGDSHWFNNQAYVDTLNPKAIEKFVEITHERYKEVVGDDFGGSIPAIFTDEPQFTRKETLGFATEMKDVTLPYTNDFHDTFQAAYGKDILAHLPEILWELPNGEISQVRYFYHDHVAERFAAAFADTVGDWCQKNGILLTGHMMEEPTLESQSCALGDCMRSYRSFQHPGIDMLCDRREYNTAKQAQSATHQYGYEGVLSELYGVTGWYFDFRGHKLQGDWQAALGVTTRVHHLTWVSMGGEAKRDYPACIGYQSPWYKEYKLIEDHFARVNTALTRGKAHVRVAVVHPVESYWLAFGPQEQTAAVREEMDENFEHLTDWLLFGLMDFDFLCESLLPWQCPQAGAPLEVGKMAYDAVIVPNMLTIRKTTLELLSAFQKQGGQLIFAGEAPVYVDAQPSNAPRELMQRSTRVPFSRTAVLSAVENLRALSVVNDKGEVADDLLVQIREEGEDRWIFLCHGKLPKNQDLVKAEHLRITLPGRVKVTLHDTMSGEIKPLPALFDHGNTVIYTTLFAHDSVLLHTTPWQEGVENPIKKVDDLMIECTARANKVVTFKESVPVTLSEPNVLLLDMAEFSLDDGPMMAKEEILRIGTQARKVFGYKPQIAQPWVDTAPAPCEHTITLRFVIQSDVRVEHPQIAMEGVENATFQLNGQAFTPAKTGWWVDESITTATMPPLPIGENELIVRLPFGRKTNLEWMYLLGDFGVVVSGASARITQAVRWLTFGDWTHQGLPFYAGNVTYHLEVETGETATLQATQYANPLLKVLLDGVDRGPLCFAPYVHAFEGLAKGKHTIGLLAYGNRGNAFAAVHNANRLDTWHGPFAWRTQGDMWAYEYQLRPMGVLISPVVMV